MSNGELIGKAIDDFDDYIVLLTNKDQDNVNIITSGLNTFDIASYLLNCFGEILQTLLDEQKDTLYKEFLAHMKNCGDGEKTLEKSIL